MILGQRQLVAGPLDADQQRAATAMRAVTRQLLATLDELLAGPDLSAPTAGDPP